MKKQLIQLIFVFLIMVISASQAFSHREDCDVYDVDVTGFSAVELLFDRVYGSAGTEIEATVSSPPSYCFDYEFYADIESLLEGPNVYSGQEESGNPDATIVEVDHDDVEAEEGTYCVTSNHQYGGSFIWNDHEGNDVYVILTGDGFNSQTEDCLTIEDEPTPTPTPTPTPGCTPFGESSLPPCPLPTVTIADVPIIEKNGERTVDVMVSGMTGSNLAKFTLRPLAGATGEARFDNNTTEITKGNGNHTLTIKGITESSAVDKMTIEVTTVNSSSVLNHKEFTVAVISSLEFQRINTTGTSPDVPLDDNPGTDGMHTPEEGQRIFPDRNTPTDGTDRSVISVRATISPAMPNAKVYFASFDLDDPSADAAPIDSNDTTSAHPGDDNNGALNVGTTSESKSGELINPTGGNCVMPSIANNVSKIECTAGTGKGSIANYRLTMQPGDNYAVEASLVETYRSAVHLDPNAGGNLINNTNQVIPISSEANPNNVQGIRTRMLTNWRKLHIEVDSMGIATGNKVEGNMNETRKVGTGTKTVLVTPTNPSTPLETDRFENGRMVINGRSYPIIDAAPATSTTPAIVANTTNSVTIRVATVFNITPTSSFTLYDDDDMDDDGGGYQYFNGDEGDDVPEPDTSSTSLINSTDTPCSNSVVSNCNVLAPAYVRPYFDLSGSHDNTPFIANLAMSVDVTTQLPVQTDVTVAYDFDNVLHEALTDFWTIYISGAYQIDNRWDSDPNHSGGVGGITDAALGNAQGALIFLEPLRTSEAHALWGTVPHSRNHTMAHEIGHIFNGAHNDTDASNGITNAGLMAQSVQNIGGVLVYRTEGTFNAVTIHKMRGGSWGGVRITHP